MAVDATPSVHELQTTPPPDNTPQSDRYFLRRFTNNRAPPPSHSGTLHLTTSNPAPALCDDAPSTPTTMARAFPHVAQSHVPCATPPFCHLLVRRRPTHKLERTIPKRMIYFSSPGGLTVPQSRPHTHRFNIKTAAPSEGYHFVRRNTS